VEVAASGIDISPLNNTCYVMVDPSQLSGHHHIFISGNNVSVKQQASSILHQFGWFTESIIDLGDITTARGAEMILPIWVRLYSVMGTGMFNLKVVR
jgi:predicted dinucleotide-binding enzyme